MVAWFSGLKDTQVRISAVTIGEIQAGIEITREQDVAKAFDIEGWLLQVAATAKVHGLTVVTRNTADFNTFDVPLFNPFAAEYKYTH